MKIAEFSIRRYGPLRDSGRIKLGKFCLFFGNNEEGKSLTIDAIIRILFGKRAKVFEKIKRVEEEPDGFVVIEDVGGKTHKFPESGDFSDLKGINPSEARDIFVIRNSDLSISNGESDRYRNVADKLTGMRTEEIERIKQSLLNLGKLTPGGEFRDVKEEKLKKRINESQEFLKDIKVLKKEVKNEKFDEAERKLCLISDKISRIETRLDQYERARKREIYEKGCNALMILEEKAQSLEELKNFTAEIEQEWMKCEVKIEREKGRESELLDECRELKMKHESIKEEQKEEERYFKILETEKRKIDDKIKPDLSNFKKRSRELEGKKAKSRFFSVACISSTILLLASLMGLLLNPSFNIFKLFFSMFLLLSVFFVIMKYQRVREEAGLKNELKRIRLEMAQSRMEAETIEEILKNIKMFDDNYELKKKELEDATRKENLLWHEIEKNEKKLIPGVKNKVDELKTHIEKIKRESHVESLGDFRKKIEKRQKNEKQRDKQMDLLSYYFGEKKGNYEERLSHWKREVNLMKIYKDEALGVSYDKEEVNRLSEKKQVLLKNKEELEEKIRDFKDKLKRVEARVNRDIRLDSDYLPCQTSVDLQEISEKLNKFIYNHEKMRENVLKTIEIFKEIEKEEEKKILDLFGKDSSISEYFFRITEGIYKQVDFNTDEKKIYVRHRKGKLLEAEKLSGGAFDQLYFSIRLGLGKKLLRGNKAFFIMDDPFIKADIKRLKEQLEILKRICDSGWQILYFTAKDEVREILENDIQKKNIDFIPIPGISY